MKPKLNGAAITATRVHSGAWEVPGKGILQFMFLNGSTNTGTAAATSQKPMVEFRLDMADPQDRKMAVTLVERAIRVGASFWGLCLCAAVPFIAACRAARHFFRSRARIGSTKPWTVRRACCHLL